MYGSLLQLLGWFWARLFIFTYLASRQVRVVTWHLPGVTWRFLLWV